MKYQCKGHKICVDKYTCPHSKPHKHIHNCHINSVFGIEKESPCYCELEISEARKQKLKLLKNEY